ncbi:MAG: SIS domain-containing protein, partial [bacterium]|nr:SIS domain-containing protein [bacterium]
DGTRELSEKIHFIFLKDGDDHPKIKKRMEVLAKLYRDRGLPVLALELGGTTRLHKIFSSLILADWTAYHLALKYNVEPEQVPMVEEFKKLI